MSGRAVRRFLGGLLLTSSISAYLHNLAEAWFRTSGLAHYADWAKETSAASFNLAMVLAISYGMVAMGVLINEEKL